MRNGPKAVRELQEAIRLDPEMIPAQLKLAGIYLLGRQFVEVDKLTQDVLAKDPNNIEALILYGQTKLHNGDFAEAEKIFLQVLDLNPKRGASFLLLGNFYARSQQFDKAIPYLRQAVALEPKNIISTLALAKVLVETGDIVGARKLYESLQTDNPDNKDLRLIVANFYLLRLGDSKLAESILREPIKKHPEDIESLMMLGDFYRRIGESEKAVGVFEKVIALKGVQTVPAKLRLAEIYLMQDRLDDVSVLVDEVLTADEKNIQGLYLRGRLRLAEYKAEDAAGDFSQVLKARPGYAPAYFYLGLSHYKMSDMALAIMELKKASQLAPDLPNARILLARIYAQEQQYNDAAAVLDEILTEQPQNYQALDLQGKILAAKHQGPEAIKVYTQMIALQPDNVVGYARRGLLYRLQKKYSLLLPIPGVHICFPVCRTLKNHPLVVIHQQFFS